MRLKFNALINVLSTKFIYDIFLTHTQNKPTSILLVMLFNPKKRDSGSRSTQWYASVSLHCPWYSVWKKSIMGHHMVTWVACILTANQINNGVFSRPGRAALHWRLYIRPHSQSLPTISSSSLVIYSIHFPDQYTLQSIHTTRFTCHRYSRIALYHYHFLMFIILQKKTSMRIYVHKPIKAKLVWIGLIL